MHSCQVSFSFLVSVSSSVKWTYPDETLAVSTLCKLHRCGWCASEDCVLCSPVLLPHALPWVCLCPGAEMQALPSGPPSPKEPGGKGQARGGPLRATRSQCPKNSEKRGLSKAGRGARAVYTEHSLSEAMERTMADHVALIWMQDRIRESQRCPSCSRMSSLCSRPSHWVQQGLWLSLGRFQPRGTMEVDRCRGIGGVREQGSDWAQEGRKVPWTEAVRTRPPSPASACQAPLASQSPVCVPT